MIKITNLTKIYDEHVDTTKALDAVSLEIKKGEMVAIMGPSGSGKSTLLNIIGCMDIESSGEYYLDKIEVSECNKKQRDEVRKKYIGFVFQHFALMDYYSAFENIELPLVAANVKKSIRKKMVKEAMEKLGILNLANKRPNKMSGGQQQRVAIARAIVSGNELILADEPTGALDQKTGQEVMSILKDLNKMGKTIIVVTHDEKIARQMDKIITICDGKVQ